MSNPLKRLFNLFKDQPVYLGKVETIQENGITVSMLDGSGAVLCNPNPAYQVGDTVQVQGQNIIGASQQLTNVLYFKV
ncbi:MAG: hypothetical protein RR280_01370 [Bacteroidaceae bacterium]